MRDVVRTLRKCESVMSRLANMQEAERRARNKVLTGLHADPLPDDDCPIRALAQECREAANHLEERTD